MIIRKKKKLLLFLLLSVLFFIGMRASMARAENTVSVFDEASESWVIQATDAPPGTSAADKVVIRFNNKNASKEKGYYYMFHGLHRQSDATISYRTVGYNLSLENAPGGAVSTLIAKDKVETVTQVAIKGGIIEGETHTQYRIDTKDMHRAVYNLLYKKYEKEGHKDPEQKALEALASPNGVEFCISNIFRTYDRKPTGEFIRWRKAPCNDLSAIQKAEDWNPLTRDYYIPHYFNVKLIIKPASILPHYDIIYEDMNGRVLKTAKTKQTIVESATVKYDLFEELQEGKLTVDGKAYQFSRQASYTYENSAKMSAVTIKDGLLTTKHTESENGVLRVKFELAHTYDVAYVDIGGNVMVTVQTGNPILKGEKATFTIPSDILKNGMTIGNIVYRFHLSASYMYDKESTKNKAEVNNGTISAKHNKDANATLRAVFVTGIPTPPITIDDIKPETYENKTTISKEYMETNASARIAADDRGAERFDVLQGIPTTESLYGEVKASEYLYDITFTKIEGSTSYAIQVEKPYTMTWEETDPMGNTVTKTEQKSATGIVYISRKYSYYELSQLNYYKLSEALLKNYALPGGELTLTPKNYTVPDVSYQHYDGQNGHLIPPAQIKDKIVLEADTGTYPGREPPAFDPEQFRVEVDEVVDQIQVRNDSFSFGGVSVLTDTYAQMNAPEINLDAIKNPAITKDNVLYTANLVIDGVKNNGIYKTTGMLSYTLVKNFRSSSGSSKTQLLQDVNSVTIHTPVYCMGQLINDNKKYVQLLNPESNAVPVVLDTESYSNDFTVQISNEGSHLPIPGYGMRDYKKYVLRNQVKFPYDVYLDIGNDSKDSNDTLITADTWYTVTSGQRFHVPMWVKEDIYTGITFRSIAVNGEGKEDISEMNANITRTNYAAWDNEWVQVSGKVYGLTLYDINDEIWKPVFRKYQSLNLKRNLGGTDGTMTGKTYNRDYIYYYTVGANNQYGLISGRSSRFTFPLIAGSHPHETNQGVLKAGYLWRFNITTTGNEMMTDASYIKITPRFYYIDKEGKNREEVDLYYSGKINGVQKNLVKIGGEVDSKNIKTGYTNDIGLAIPESEMRKTAAIRNKNYIDWLKQKDTMYTYGGMRTKLAFKTYAGAAYAEAIKKRSGMAPSVTENEVTRRKQSYYFNYSIPNNFKAVKKGFDFSTNATINYKESFWKKNGYIIINFEITCYDKDGNAYLSYINTSNYLNEGYGSMWVLEGAPYSKADHYNKTFQFMAGDTLMMDTDKTSYDDYKAGGIY